MAARMAAVSDLLRSVKDAKLRIEASLALHSLGATDRSGKVLRFESSINSGKVVLKDSNLSVLDEQNNPTHLSFAFGLLTLDILHLWTRTPASTTFDVIAKGSILFIPVWNHIVTDIPINVHDLATWAAAAAKPPVPSDASPEDPAPQKPSPSRHVRFDVSFNLEPGAILNLNETTNISVASTGTAAVSVTGVQDYAVATINGTNISISSPQVQIGPSDINMQVTLNRREGGKHIIAFDTSTLRNLQFEAAGFSPPAIDELIIAASKGKDGARTYDFIISIDPSNDFTVKDLVAQVMQRIGDPKVVAALKEKLAEKAGDVASSGPTSFTIDSARWNIVDYVAHGGKAQVAAVLDLPHIRLGMQDPAMNALAKNALPNLRLFMAATQLQSASRYDTKFLVEMARLALTPNMLAVLEPSVAPTLLRVLGYSPTEVAAFDPNQASHLKKAETVLKSVKNGESPYLVLGLAMILVGAGNALNAKQRKTLREYWVDAGGLERNGKAYVLLAKFIEALHGNVKEDPTAPASLKTMLAKVPTGEALTTKMAVASDNLRGAIWASQNVVPDGWGPVSARLEKELGVLFGGKDMPTVNVPALGSSVFRDQAANAQVDSERFFPAQVRFIGNGEEFFQQIIKLLEDTSAAAEHFDDKGTVVLNYWSFEAIYVSETEKANVWGLMVAEKLKELAMEGFSVSIIVDEKNGPSRRGQVGLQKMAEEVRARGRGTFACHPWLPRAERFPLGTHVKYLVTALGVIAGGSNLGDHYLHWSDTNILLRGAEAVRTFAAHHDAILREQRAVGLAIAPVPVVEAGDDAGAWAPLETYAHGAADAGVFHAEWEAAGVRTFRDQGGDARDRILLEHIAALDAARGAGGARPAQTVFIANAYFALPQPLDEHPFARALSRALARGVDVELITNTVDSIDQPIVAGPIVKSVFLIMKRARGIARAARTYGGTAGTFTVHLPTADYIGKDADDLPEVLIHDKLLFFENMAFVGTHNFHPRSFTMEQEFLTELLGQDEPADDEAHEMFLERARHHFKDMMQKPGGDRVKSIDDLMAPLVWNGGEPPALWGPAGHAYVLFQEKKWLYCHSYSSRTDDEVRKVEALIDVSTKGSLPDLIINAF